MSDAIQGPRLLPGLEGDLHKANIGARAIHSHRGDQTGPPISVDDGIDGHVITLSLGSHRKSDALSRQIPPAERIRRRPRIQVHQPPPIVERRLGGRLEAGKPRRGVRKAGARGLPVDLEAVRGTRHRHLDHALREPHLRQAEQSPQGLRTAHGGQDLEIRSHLGIWQERERALATDREVRAPDGQRIEHGPSRFRPANGLGGIHGHTPDRTGRQAHSTTRANGIDPDPVTVEVEGPCQGSGHSLELRSTLQIRDGETSPTPVPQNRTSEVQGAVEHGLCTFHFGFGHPLEPALSDPTAQGSRPKSPPTDLGRP